MRSIRIIPLFLALTALPAAAQEGEQLLTAARIAALPAAEREAWTRYVAESARLKAADAASIAAEVRAAGRSEWTPAEEGPSFYLGDEMTAEWFRGAEARRMADIILSYQTPTGGWSKRVSHTGQPRQPGQGYTHEGRNYVGTFDNGATTEEMRFLAGAYEGHGDARFRDGYLRGLAYTLRAQLPTGCWPQVYPLQGGYHDAATFNDDATVRILRVLRDAAAGKPAFVPPAERQRARTAVDGGVECIVRSQIVVDGKLAGWGAQHDPITLAPVKARAYEHRALSGREGAEVMNFLMQLDAPSPRVAAAVHAGAAWFRRVAIQNMAYQVKGELTPREGAGPIWARFYEIGTDRPIFSNRDGVVRYAWSELEPERRYGYGWYTDEPATTLRRYDRWARTHPAR